MKKTEIGWFILGILYGMMIVAAVYIIDEPKKESCYQHMVRHLYENDGGTTHFESGVFYLDSLHCRDLEYIGDSLVRINPIRRQFCEAIRP